jgi:hypothetical protein
MLKPFLIFIAVCCIAVKARSQDNPDAADKIAGFPAEFLKKADNKTTSLDDALTKQTEKYLQRLAKKEARLKRKLYKVDSATTKSLFANDPTQQYQALIQKLKSDSIPGTASFTGQYMPYLDSLKGSLSFLNKNPQLTGASKILPADLQNSLGHLQQLQAKMESADEIKQYLQQRKQQIKNILTQYSHLPPGITGIYNNYSKESFYYSQQVKEYKDLLNDPDKAMKTALTVLNKVPAFTSFMKKNSMLASLFNIPGAVDNANPAQAVAGLQSRSQVTQLIQNQVGQSGPNINTMVQQNLQSAQGQMNTLRDKLKSLGGGSGDPDSYREDMPNFKPNNQRTKSFLKRLEYGTNIQSAQSNTFFPTTTDLGLSVGYKLNDKSTIGIGASYKIGWGSNVRHIVLTTQGMGLRSFLDVKLKGSFYASGGFEYNYQPPTLPDSLASKGLNASSWQQSGLIGLTKIVSLKSKTFKKTRIQLLWDFLSYQQRPQTQAFKFRIGYNF